MKNENVAILLVNYNSWLDSIECLESLKNLDYKEYSVFLVDNCSTNDSFNKLKEYFYKNNFQVEENLDENNCHFLFSKNFFLIRNNFNNGFAAGNNFILRFLIKKKYYNFFWLLNNDTIVLKNTLSELLRNDDDSIGVLGSSLLYYFNRDILQSAGVKYLGWKGVGCSNYENFSFSKIMNKNDIVCNGVVGASLLIKRIVIDKIGLMDENYFMMHEESDWCIRARNVGFKILLKIDSIVYHKDGGSSLRKYSLKKFLMIKSNRVNFNGYISFGYYEIRNEIYFVKKNFKKYFLFYFILKLIPKLFSKFIGIYLFNDSFKYRRIKIIFLAVYDGIIGRMGKRISYE